MTSRFGKTYSRKGGESTSKFDEVLSTKRGTLSTKWGDTKYKAKVGSKRAAGPKLDSALEVFKRPRGGGGDDPFGFDSDEESKPVSSRVKSAEKPALETNSSWANAAGLSHTTTAAAAGNRATWSETVFNNSSSSSLAGKPQLSCLSSDLSSEQQLSYSWYQNASDSDRQPLAQTTTLKTGFNADSSSSFDSWDAIMGLRPPSPSSNQEPQNPALSLWAFTGQAVEEKPVSPPQNNDFPTETLDFSPPLVRNVVCRTYRRSIKNKDSSELALEVPKSRENDKATGQGRTRDHTVLHPSSMSACNVTIQERAADGASSGGSSGNMGELGEASWRKKTDKNTSRFGETQSKSKKDSDLGLFGFEEVDSGQNQNSSVHTDGRSNYKIKYFGFDDTSDSDGEDGGSKERRNKTKRAAVMEVEEEEEEEPEEEPPDPFERLEQLQRDERMEWTMREKPMLTENKKNSEKQERSIRTDMLDFSEEGLRVLAGSIRRPPLSKTSEKDPDSFRRIFSAHKKSPTKAVYNARHWTVDSEEEPPPACFSKSQPAPSTVSGPRKESAEAHKDDGLFKAPPPPPKVTKCVKVPLDPCQDTVTALKCHKEHKELYTVVQHVKHFNDVVEFGENQEFTDDFEYLATGLKTGLPLNTRCLSVISLATRCAMPSFRMHLRALGKVAQVFKMLNDAPQHQNLALCTAALMYILSRDRLNMDLDRSCLELMIRLLELDHDQGVASAAAVDSTQLSAREIAKIKEKIRKLCDMVHNKHLDLQNITTGHLAMETLLSLTSKRAGDWFKEELRLLGGLDHIVDKVKECVHSLNREDDKEKLVSSLWGAERCLRVLESVTVHNPENQSYLIAYKDSSLIVSSAKALSRCEQMIQRYSREVSSDRAAVGKAVEDCMRAIIGVLLNLTHDNEWGSTKTGEQEDLINTALNCVLKVPQYLPQEQRFDIRVLGLGLLINLVEYSARNRYGLMEMEMEAGPCETTVILAPNHDSISSTGSLSAIAALVQLFLQRERAAILAEAQTDDLIKETPKPADQSGQWQETGGEIQWVANENAVEKPEKEKEDEEDEELDLNKALQHAGKHMEDTMVASYTALLLGCLCQGSPTNVTTVRENLPKGDFSIMTEMLKKFLNFMNLTCDVGTTGQKSISRIIDYLEHC